MCTSEADINSICTCILVILQSITILSIIKYNFVLLLFILCRITWILSESGVKPCSCDVRMTKTSRTSIRASRTILPSQHSGRPTTLWWRKPWALGEGKKGNRWPQWEIDVWEIDSPETGMMPAISSINSEEEYGGVRCSGGAPDKFVAPLKWILSPPTFNRWLRPWL